jgi:aspartate/methionine/tyrosine aminotransferase
VEAAVRALREGKHHYSPNAGIFELRRAIADKYAAEYRLAYDPGSEVIVTNGVAEAVYIAVNALLDPGDQVLIPDPGWVNYGPDAFTALVEPVAYTLREDCGFQPDPEEIHRLITPRTRMLILASPSNPTGGVIGREIFARIAALAVENDLVVVSDEIYEKVIYPPAEHICAANEIPGFSASLPAGAFYLFPSIEATGLDGFRMSELLLEKTGVATVAGEAFGRRGAGHIRISYANSLENLEAAAGRIREAAAEL